MDVHQGHSSQSDAAAAVAEATRPWPADFEPRLILAHASTRQPLAEVRAALRERYPGAELAGCTTSGEHSTGAHHRGALVLTAIGGADLRVTTAFVGELAALTAARVETVTDGLFSRLGLSRDDLDLDHTFCLLFIDGLSKKEEQVAAWLADALDGVPLVGGSAGDDLAFQRTEVLSTEAAGSGAAVLVLGHASVPLRVFKHQHFVPTATSLVITRADVVERRVYEMDGYPAAEAYARALGLESAAALTSELTFTHPVILRSHGQDYVRSIQRVEADGSLVFYCGIEEGMVLEVARHADIEGALDVSLGQALDGFSRPQLVLGANCILRALEAEKLAKHEQLAGVMARHADCFAAFDTYGEQLGGLHINQTIVGIAFGR